jgi:hypothetical protein
VLAKVREDEQFLCPVCGYEHLDSAAFDDQGSASFELCPCCGTEFGYDDASTTHAELRERWLSAGARWHSGSVIPPLGWDANSQVRAASALGIFSPQKR